MVCALPLILIGKNRMTLNKTRILITLAVCTVSMVLAAPELDFIAPPVPGHVHASTLAALPNGDYIAAWFEGTKESAPDVAIWGAKRQSGTWETKRMFAKAAPVAHWNPVLRLANDGRLVLYFKVGAKIPDWQTFFCESRDGGATWDTPRELVPNDRQGGRGPVKNKCIKLKNGRWLAPASWEKGCWRAFVDTSDDDGRHWRNSPLFPIPADADKTFGVIQPSLWESADGIHALMRAKDGWIWRSDSRDGGLNWSEIYRTPLENINSGLDLVRASNGNLYLAMNGKSAVTGGWGSRHHLEVKVSEDDGKSWRTLMTLAHSDKLKQPDGRTTEFSYPAIIEARPGLLAVTFTYNRRQIAFVEIPIPAATSTPVR